jgi:hypothetical protein
MERILAVKGTWLENFSSHRCAPLTAPVPFLKTAGYQRKGANAKAPGSRLAPALISGQTAAGKEQGLRPCDPARKKHRNYRLTQGSLLMEAATVRKR